MKKVKKVLVLGNGLLGSELFRQGVVYQNKTNYEYMILSREFNKFDIRNIEAYNVLLREVDIIVNCIAVTDTSLTKKEDYWDVNVKAVQTLAMKCNELGIKLVQISTDYVYANSQKFATEETIPSPGNNWYSYSKLIADEMVMLASNDYLICRGTHKPTPFPHDKAWNDQWGNFDYVDVMARLIRKLIEKEATGLVNIGTDYKSMYELAFRTKPNVGSTQSPNKVPKSLSMHLVKLRTILNEDYR